MDCQQVEQLLSHYFDHELRRDERAEVESHLENCPPCSDQLADIRMLSDAARSLSSARPPHDLWDRIAAQLKEPRLPESVNNHDTVDVKSRSSFDQRRSWSLFAVAAVLLIGVGMAWMFQQSSHPHDPLVSYAQLLDSSPLAAQEHLVSQYSGQTVSVDEAVQLVGYRPRNVDPPPSGYSCDKLVVLDMPCCKCVQAVWQHRIKREWLFLSTSPRWMIGSKTNQASASSAEKRSAESRSSTVSSPQPGKSALGWSPRSE